MDKINSLFVASLLLLLLAIIPGAQAEFLDCYEYQNNPNSTHVIEGYIPTRFGEIGEYVLFENHGKQLVIFDASEPLNPVVIYEGYMNIDFDYFFDGSHILKGDSMGGYGYKVTLFDATDPTAYTSLGGHYLRDDSGRWFSAVDFRVYGDFLIVAGSRSFGDGALFIYDLSSNTYSWPETIFHTDGFPTAMVYLDERLFVGMGSMVKVYDVSVPDDPILLEQIDLPGIVEYLLVHESFLYASGEDLLNIIDLQVPGSYEVVASLPVGSDPGEIQIQGDTAFVVDRFYGIHVVDISSPSAPIQEETMVMSGGCRAMAVVGDYIYRADGYGLQVIDRSQEWVNPSNVVYPMKGSGLSSKGNLVFSIAEDKYRITDFSYPSEPVVLGELEFGFWGGIRHYEGDNVAIVSSSYSSDTFIVDISNPENPTIVSTLFDDGRYASISGILIGDFGYLDDPQSNDILVFDLTDPLNPSLIANISQQGPIKGMAHFDNYLLLGGYNPHEVQVIDISSPESPQVISNLELAWAPLHFAVQGDLVYCAGSTVNSPNFAVISMDDPSNPVLLSESYFRGWPKSLDVKDSVAYLATSEGVQVVDVSKSEAPEMLGSLGGSHCSLVVLEDQILINSGSLLFGSSLQCDSTTPVFLSWFDVEQKPRVVQIRWEVSEAVDPDQFRLWAKSGYGQRELSIFKESPRSFFAEVDLGVFHFGETLTLQLEFLGIGQQWVKLVDRTLTIEGDNPGLALMAAPNPFNASTSVEFFLKQPQFVQLGIFGIDGRKILGLENQRLAAGKHRYVWNGNTQSGHLVSSGMYFIRLDTEEVVRTIPVSIVK